MSIHRIFATLSCFIVAGCAVAAPESGDVGTADEAVHGRASCDGVVCTHGQICEPGIACEPCAADPDSGECHPCDPIPARCVDRPKKDHGHASDDPCKAVRCASGYHCEAVQIWCITTPCDPIAECVADPCDTSECGPALGMPSYLCPDGVTVAGPTGSCLRNTDGTCGWEIASCP